jgi:hypothetical protein
VHRLASLFFDFFKKYNKKHIELNNNSVGRNVNKITIAFIVLVVSLFSGIGILMKPTSIIPVPEAEEGRQPTDTIPALKALITIGSAFILIGLVGLAVLGFMISRKGEPQKKHNSV